MKLCNGSNQLSRLWLHSIIHNICTWREKDSKASLAHFTYRTQVSSTVDWLFVKKKKVARIVGIIGSGWLDNLWHIVGLLMMDAVNIDCGLWDYLWQMVGLLTADCRIIDGGWGDNVWQIVELLTADGGIIDGGWGVTYGRLWEY